MISLLYAMDREHVIGNNGKLPWHLPADLAYFKKVTMGKKIVMGRKTYESIGKPLPGRENIIVTRNFDFLAEGCKIIHSVDELFDMDDTLENEEIFVIGGAELFTAVLNQATRQYVTVINDVFEGDTHFNGVNDQEWKLVSSQEGIRDDRNPYDYSFLVYERKQ